MNVLLSLVPWWARWLGLLALVAAASSFSWVKKGEWDAGRQAEADLRRVGAEDAARAAELAARKALQTRIDELLAAREGAEQQFQAATEAAVRKIKEAPRDPCSDAYPSRDVLEQLRAPLPDPAPGR